MTADIDLTFNEVDHSYKLNGVAVPSVTRVLGLLDPFIMNEHLQEAMDKGTAVHDICEQFDKGQSEVAFGDHGSYLYAWRSFLQDSGFIATEVEVKVCHPKMMYAGRVDRVGSMGADLTIIDIKTGSARPTHKLQLAAYAAAYQAQFGPKVKRLACVYLRPNGTYSVDWKQDPNSLYTFLAALRCYRWQEEHKR